jgi:hypothetical protein
MRLECCVPACCAALLLSMKSLTGVTKAAISELGEPAGAVATAVANPGPDGAQA